MESREERKRRLTRERVANHRERQKEAQFVKHEQAAQRALDIEKHGEDKVLDREHYDSLAVVSLGIQEFLMGKPSQVKVSPTLDEDLQAYFNHLEKEFNSPWYDGHLDNSFERCARMGLLPRPVDAAHYFRKLYASHEFNQTGETK